MGLFDSLFELPLTSGLKRLKEDFSAGLRRASNKYRKYLVRRKCTRTYFFPSQKQHRHNN